MDSSSSPDQRFVDFVLFQAQNAGLFLGQIPHPSTGEKTLNLKAAQSVLDSLEMLNDKTSGNLTEKEAQLLEIAVTNVKKLMTENG